MPSLRLFLSYCHADQARAMKLREALKARGVPTWADRFELNLGDDLARVNQELLTCDGAVQVVSAEAMKSDWIKDERDWALEAEAARRDSGRPFRLMAVHIGLDPDIVRAFYGRNVLTTELVEPVGLVADRVLEALQLVPKSLPVIPPKSFSPGTNALVISLSSPRRTLIGEGPSTTGLVHARVRVHHQPAKGPGSISPTFDFTSPITEKALLELRWYLERYPDWPYGPFRTQAKALEAQLPRWGKELYRAILEPAWQQVFDWKHSLGDERRIVIEVEASEHLDPESRLASAGLLALPWELLHDNGGYLFDGRKGARILRRIPSAETREPFELQPILRVLLVLARPEEPGVEFIDPRASVHALTEALDPLGDRVELKVLPDGTFAALNSALYEARRAGNPFSVVHFDGYGVFYRDLGLGQLSFEDAEDVNRVTRRAERVDADRLGSLLRDHRVPLCVLGTCQSAPSEGAVESSVATGLLKAGVGSVVVMSHSVLAETTRRFTGAFYSSLAAGLRIGEAMNRATHELRDKQNRAPAYSDESLKLHDWMVPVLYQEHWHEAGGDLALVPPGNPVNPESLRLQKTTGLGELPKEAPHGFVGRARVILDIHRRLRPNTALALTGPGGQGKTALALASARWLSETRQVERIAFVSVEQITHLPAVLDAVGRQLVNGYSSVMDGGIGTSEQQRQKALLRIHQALQDHPTLLIIDNMESLLAPPGSPANDESRDLLTMLEHLREVGRTRILLTSREAPPSGLEHGIQDVPRLSSPEGIQLVRRKLMQASRTRLSTEQKERIESLVEQVGGHARALVLLAPLVARRGASLTSTDLAREMERLEQQHPGDRENSLLASVRLSLKRLPANARKQVRALAVFRGVAHVEVLSHVLQVEVEEALELCRKLVDPGLATAEGPYLILDPALRVTLDRELESEERKMFVDRWFEGMVGLIDFLYKQYFQDTQIAVDGTRTSVVELLAVLEEGVRRAKAEQWSVEEAIYCATYVEQLLSVLGLPRWQQRAVKLRQQLQSRLAGGWTDARFVAEFGEIERLQEAGQVDLSLNKVQELLALSETTDGNIQLVQPYDLAMLHWKKGQLLRQLGPTGPALISLEKARKSFQILTGLGIENAARMLSVTLTELANALMGLGHLEECALLLEQCGQLAESQGNRRDAAVARSQLGTIRLQQRRLDDALAAHQQARAYFEALGEPREVANACHLVGWTYRELEDQDAAEKALKESLSIRALLGDKAGQADSFNLLGIVEQDRGRFAESLPLLYQASELYRHFQQSEKEGRALNNLARSLWALDRLDEAREAITRSLSLKTALNVTAESWNTWSILQDIELQAGNDSAALEARQKSMSTYQAARRDGWQALDALSHLIDQLAKLAITEGLEPARARVPPVERFAATLHPIRNALLSILNGSIDYTWRDNFAIHPRLAVELDRLAEAVYAQK